ncbi:MAG TPA: choice-of-anchor B family protein [Brumimicrobium sp.]|nr:choice-of-anchor B family protein [Brumimicrobium sp.]
MKLFLLLITFLSFGTFAQNYNLDSLSHVDYTALHDTELNDVWGYTDEFGNEYALVGAEKGVSVVDITDPENPFEVYWHVGSSSVWRDIKTFGDYAYVTTEAEDGLLIIDLSPLPSNPIVNSANYFGDTKIWQSAHNLYIDENGFGYIFGSNHGNGGAIILDLFTNPMQPQEVGEFDNWYIHDGFVVNNTLYAAHVNDGFFTIVDVTDKSNPIVLGSHATPSSFTHNIWPTADQNYVFTTDEVSNGYLTAYNVSDPQNIYEVDRIQTSTQNGVVPHNSHVIGDFLVTSYYADGVIIHDISDPSNMVEVGRYDTYPGTANYTIGNWGVYPFFTSGTIAATDVENGLFILKPNYKYAAKVEGTVTNLDTSDPIQGVDVTIQEVGKNKQTKVNGGYKTGTVSSGNYTIQYKKYGYETKDVVVTLTENMTLTLDVELKPLAQYNVTIKVVDQNNNPILGADVRIKHLDVVFDAQTNGLGEVKQNLSYSDLFYVASGKWGYVTKCSNIEFSPSMNTFTFVLEEGYNDDFSFDFGWSTTASATQGLWERAVPYSSIDTIMPSVPNGDSPFDCGEYAYVTGNSDNNSVAGGEVILISPVFDISNMSDPYLNYDRWFFNYHGYVPFNDTLRIAISNGVDLVEIDKQGFHADVNGIWTNVSKRISEHITHGTTMQLFIQTSDFFATNNITNAAFDNFIITNGSPLSTNKVPKKLNEIKVYPNPFDRVVIVEGVLKTENIYLYDLLGKRMKIDNIAIENGKTTIETSHLSKGAYFIQVNNEVLKLIKE